MSREASVKYPRRTQRKAETRRRIIESTLRLVSESGSDVITMQAVADCAEIHVTTLFTHFTHKTELFTSLTEPAIAVLEQTVAGARAARRPFFEFLEEVQGTYASALQAGGKTQANQSLHLRSQAELLPAWLRYEKRQLILFAEYLADDLGLRHEHARLVAGMIVSANIAAYDEWIKNPNTFDLVETGRWNTREIRRMIEVFISDT